MLHKRTRDLNAICKSYVDFIAKQTKACTNLRKLVGTGMQFRKVFGPENKARKDLEGTKDNCKDLCVIWTKLLGQTAKPKKQKPRDSQHGMEGLTCKLENMLD